MLKLKSFGVAAVLAVSLALPATSAAQRQDLRNPDRQFPTAPAPAQDLRNADRRAPAAGEVDIVPVKVPTTIELPGDGFDWGDAGIGAAGGVAVLAMLAGLALAATHRRRERRVAA